jgi:hypothetical protein
MSQNWCDLKCLAIGSAAALALSGCASWGTGCGAGEQPAVAESLYFGTARPGGTVSIEEWRRFIDDVVTTRFPQGLTTWPAAGQWRGADGLISREPSHVLLIVHAPGETHELAIREIMEQYKTRFQQEAVLRVRGRACMSF